MSKETIEIPIDASHLQQSQCRLEIIYRETDLLHAR